LEINMTTKAEQEAIREELAKIAEENGGRLTPEAVVAAASNRASVLHDFFEWDAKKAAQSYRIEQARMLIRSVRVIVKTEKTTISTVAYIRDPDAENEEQGYVATVSLLGDTARARVALVNEFSRAAAALRRARELALVFAMADEIDALTTTVETMRTKVKAKVQQATVFL
jgi:hypothetical protein